MNRWGLRKLLSDLIYKPGTGKIYWAKLISIFVITVGLVSAYFYGQVKHNRLSTERKTDARYTVGFTTGRHKNHRSASSTVSYYYWVGDHKFEQTQSFSSQLDIQADGGKYYVEYARDNPDNAMLLLDRPVSGMHPFPQAGWDSIPE